MVPSTYHRHEYKLFCDLFNFLVTGVICAIAGFGIAIQMAGAGFDNVHSWFGLITMALAIIAPTGGIAADLMYDPKRFKVPIWPDKVHW